MAMETAMGAAAQRHNCVLSFAVAERQVRCEFPRLRRAEYGMRGSSDGVGKNSKLHGYQMISGSEVLCCSRLPRSVDIEAADWKVQARKGSLAVRAYGAEGEVYRQESAAIALRRLLNTPGVHQGPACHDALSAKLVEMAGFSFAFMSGFAVSAAKLASPDTGLISYGEMVEQGRHITAAVSIPVIGDGDNGYGNALNVKRTVKGYAQAGFAGILIEDQVSPKACGHTNGRKVISREEAVAKIRAAVDARIEANSDIVIVARTDARQAVSLDEALWRVKAFAEVGADVLFIDALTSREEMVAFCKVAPGVPKMASMLEGGGKTPILAPFELEEMGFKLVAYPLSLIGVCIRAMQDALKAIKSGRLPPPGDLPTFEQIKEVVGFGRYYAEDEYYSSTTPAVSYDNSPSAPMVEDLPISDSAESSYDPQCDQGSNAYPRFNPGYSRYDSGWRSGAEWNNTPLPDVTYINPEVMEPQAAPSQEKGSLRSTLEKLWSRKLRVKVTSNNGLVKLDIRIPAGFLDGLAATVPGVAGLNLRGMLNEAAFKSEGKLESGQQLLDITDLRGERFEVFLE